MARKPGPGRSTRNLALAKRQLLKDIGDRCSDIAKNRGINLFDILLHYVEGNAEALGYQGQRTRFLKDGGVIMEDWVTPEMRFAAVKEALQYVSPKLNAVAIQDLTPPDENETQELRKVSRKDIIAAIKGDPFFVAQANEIIDITPEETPQLPSADPFKD